MIIVQDSYCKNKIEYQVQKNTMHANDANHVTSFTSHATELQVGNSLRLIKGAKPCDKLAHQGTQMKVRGTEKDAAKAQTKDRRNSHCLGATGRLLLAICM